MKIEDAIKIARQGGRVVHESDSRITLTVRKAAAVYDSDMLVEINNEIEMSVLFADGWIHRNATFDYNEAVNQALAGNRVSRENWDDNRYLYIKDEQLVTQDGNRPYLFMDDLIANNWYVLLDSGIPTDTV